MKKLLLTLVLILASVGAKAQSINVFGAPPLSGASMTTPLNFGAGTLFLPTPGPATLLPPFGESMWVKLPAGFNPSIETFLENISTAGTAGWQTFWRSSNQDTFTWQFALQGLTAACFQGGHVCTRGTLLSDNNLHHVCISSNGGFSFLMIDGQMRDTTNLAGAINANTTGFLAVGATFNSINNASMNMGQIMLRSGKGFSAADCAYIYNLGHNGLIPGPTDPVVQGLWAWWPLDPAGCTPTVSCPDVSGNNRNLLYDFAPTAVSVLTPPPSPPPLVGTVSLTASCTDLIAVTKVTYVIDNGLTVGSATTAPYTVPWNTALLTDNTYQLTAVCTNVSGGTLTSAPVSVTTANSNSAQAWYFSNTGVHGRDCKTPATSCPPSDQPTAPGARQYLDGDSINLDATNGVTLTASSIIVCGATITGSGNLNCTKNANQGTLTHPIIIQSYNGSSCIPLAGLLSACANVKLDPNSALVFPIYIANTTNVTTRNLQAACGNTAGLAQGGGVAIRIQSGVTNANFTITNNLLKDCGIGDIFLASVHGDTSLFVGNLTVSNNLLTASTTTTTVDSGMLFQGTVGGTFTSNVCSNMGGHPSLSDGGGGCAIANTYQLNTPSHSFVMQDSVSLNTFANTASCGGPATFWSANVANLNIQFVEGWNMGPTIPAGCDSDFYDQDQATQNSVSQYGYGHANAGNCLLFFNATPAGELTWQNNVQRYTICENNGISHTGTPSGAPGFGSAFAGTGTTPSGSVYGNTIYSSLVPPFPPNNRGSNCATLLKASADFVNNLCVVANTLAPAYAWGIGIVPVATNLTIKTNLFYYPGGAPALFSNSQPNYTTLAAFQAGTGYDAGSVGTALNPNLANMGNGGNCYTGTGIPSAPQPCPSAYKLTGTGPAYSFATNPGPYNLTTFPDLVDYYLNGVPNLLGTGWNAGAYGANP